MWPRVWGLVSRPDRDIPKSSGLSPVDSKMGGKIGFLKVGSKYTRLSPAMFEGELEVGLREAWWCQCSLLGNNLSGN